MSLRPSVFASNFAGMWAPQIRAGDVVGGPYASASTAPIVDADIAAVAARTLLSDDLVGTDTADRSTGVDQRGTVVGAVLGRELVYVEAPEDVVRQRFLGIGFPPEFADAYMALLAETVDRPALVTHDVEKILDRPARPFAQWVAEHRNLFTDSKGDDPVREEPTPTALAQEMNKLVIAVQKLGIPAGPSMVLTVPGRKSGEPRSTPMTPFDHDGGLYTVAGYPGADWAANARAAGVGTFTRGRQVSAGADRRAVGRRLRAGAEGVRREGAGRRRVRQAQRARRRRHAR